jgi:hypothetical protein
VRLGQGVGARCGLGQQPSNEPQWVKGMGAAARSRREMYPFYCAWSRSRRQRRPSTTTSMTMGVATELGLRLFSGDEKKEKIAGGEARAAGEADEQEKRRDGGCAPRTAEKNFGPD